MITFFGGMIMNKDITKLKTSADNVPRYESLIPYVLEVIKDKQPVHKREIQDRMIKFLSIPDEILNLKYIIQLGRCDRGFY